MPTLTLRVMSIGVCRILRGLLARLSDEGGQTLGEYAVLIGFIAIVVFAAAVFLGHQINTLYNNVTNAIASI